MRVKRESSCPPGYISKVGILKLSVGDSMVETRTAPDVLAALISSCDIVSRADLDEAVSIAKQLQISVDRALIMSDVVTEEKLKPVLEAKARLQAGGVSMDVIVKALRLAIRSGHALDEALREITSVHTRTAVAVSATNELTSLLLNAKLMTAEQLGEAIKKSAETGMLIGRVLLLEGVVSLPVLAAALNDLFLVRDAKLDKDKAVQGLKYASQREITIEQALFELQFFTQPSALSLRIGELFEMAGVISAAHMVECLEVEFFKHKQFGQILLEQGLVTPEQLEAAVLVQNAVATESLWAFQAAEALKKVCQNNVNVYQAMAEVTAALDPNAPELKLGQLLVEAGVASKSAIEEALEGQSGSNVKIGKILLNKGSGARAHISQ